jgi:hypothetical protein
MGSLSAPDPLAATSLELPSPAALDSEVASNATIDEDLAGIPTSARNAGNVDLDAADQRQKAIQGGKGFASEAVSALFSKQSRSVFCPPCAEVHKDVKLLVEHIRKTYSCWSRCSGLYSHDTTSSLVGHEKIHDAIPEGDEDKASDQQSSVDMLKKDDGTFEDHGAVKGLEEATEATMKLTAALDQARTERKTAAPFL